MRGGSTIRNSNPIESLEQLLYDAQFNRYLDTDGPMRNELAVEKLAGIFDAELLKQACKLKSRTLSPNATTLIGQLEQFIKQNRKSPSQLRKVLGQLDYKPSPDSAALAGRGTAQMRSLIEALDAARVARVSRSGSSMHFCRE